MVHKKIEIARMLNHRVMKAIRATDASITVSLALSSLGASDLFLEVAIFEPPATKGRKGNILNPILGKLAIAGQNFLGTVSDCARKSAVVILVGLRILIMGGFLMGLTIGNGFVCQ
jgi:hypothetical protein